MKIKKYNSQSGVALLVALFAILVVSAIGMAMMYSSNTETMVNDNYRRNQQLYFAARAGIEEARVRLWSGAGSSAISIPTALPSTSAANVTYLLNPSSTTESVTPWSSSTNYFDDQLCHAEFSGLSLTDSGTDIRCAGVPSGSSWYTTNHSSTYQSSTALPWKWVRITLKDNKHNTPFVVDSTNGASNTQMVCWDGSEEILLPANRTSCDQVPSDGMKPVYVLTAKAVQTVNGTVATKYVQMEVAQNPPFKVSGAVDSQDHVTLNGQLTVDGYDQCSCTCTQSGNGNNISETCTNRSGGYTCDNSKWALYSSSTVDNPTASESFFSGQNPAIAQNKPSDHNIQNILSSYLNSGNVVNTTSSPYNWTCTSSNCGTQSAGGVSSFGTVPTHLPDTTGGTTQITYVPGSVQLTGGWTGNGVLLVNGDLDIHGGLNFYGVIVVTGVIKFTGGGSDSTNINGAVIAGQESLVDNTLGGSATIKYNSCAVNQAYTAASPKMVAIRELSY